MSRFSRTDQSFLGKWWWTIDRGMFAGFILLMIIGVLLVATASPPVALHHGLNAFYFLTRHIIALVPALIIFLTISTLEPRMLWRVSSVVFALSIFALIMVLFVGIEIKGARRWIHLPGLSLQPSEFIKPSFVIVSAWLIALQKKGGKFPGNAVVAGLYGLIITLLLMQPDLGMSVLVTCGWAALIFLAGMRFRLLFIFAGFAIAGLAFSYITFDHVHSRINRFLDPESGDNYQVERSLEAFQNGGLIGTGPGQGTVKLGLPDAHADFIFSVAGEEMGLIFLLVLILIYGAILFRGLNKLTQSDDLFCILAAGGLLTIFGLQAFIHMGSALHLLPAKGMTLPFISYGGSSLWSISYAMGAVMALTRRTGRSSVSRGGLSL